MEKVFTRAGIVVVDAIETEVLGRTSSVDESGQNDPNRLQIMAAFSTVLSGLWDAKTYLRQQYGLAGTCYSTANEAFKNSSRAPSKVDNIDGRAFWERSSLIMVTPDSEQTMLTQCRAFVEFFHEDIGSKVVAIGGGDLPSGIPSTTGDKEGGKLMRLKGRKRKAPETRSAQKKRKIQSKR
jgi:cohesin loading factor subunit SCC2